MAAVTAPVPRRERVRQATIEEIKKTARDQLAEHGAAALSLRAVARAMGMTPSALYRYFDSRASLISALARDAFSSLADALEAAFDAAPTDEHSVRWLLVARAHRRWALEHPTEYTLIFGPQPSDVPDKSDQVLAELHRSVNVLFRCMVEAIASGVACPDRLDIELSPRLREDLAAWMALEQLPLSPAGAAACITAWTQLHGFIALEVFGHLPSKLGSPDDLYDQQMLGVFARLIRLGPHSPPDFATVIARADRATSHHPRADGSRPATNDS